MRPGALVLVTLLLAATARPASAEEPDAAAPTDDDAVVAARTAFVEGTTLVKQERWAEALVAFERAAARKPHAITTYNMAQCERAMGQYTRARRLLLTTLAQDAASGDAELPAPAKVEARALLGELEAILPRVTVTLRPEDAAVSVDGRPLEPLADAPTGADPTFVAGVLAPGPGAPLGVSRFRVDVNPGAHVFTVSRRGYQDVVVNRSLPPGAKTSLDLELDKLPASIHVTSTLKDGIVRVNGVDVGNPPVDVSRAAGRYTVTVTRRGFVTYEADVSVRPGERVELAATMREEKRALTQQWWFWTAAGVLVVGAAAGTYALTRKDPEPTRPAPDGGGLGWSLVVR